MARPKGVTPKSSTLSASDICATSKTDWKINTQNGNRRYLYVGNDPALTGSDISRAAYDNNVGRFCGSGTNAQKQAKANTIARFSTGKKTLGSGQNYIYTPKSKKEANDILKYFKQRGIKNYRVSVIGLMVGINSQSDPQPGATKSYTINLGAVDKVDDSMINSVVGDQYVKRGWKGRVVFTGFKNQTSDTMVFRILADKSEIDSAGL